MSQFRAFTGSETQGTIVVRVLDSPEGPRAFIRQVSDPADVAEDTIEQSEEMPVEEALALARNKAANMDGGAEIVIDLGPDAKWDDHWGRLD
ncbi:hypothetical protein [Pelagibacterium luteolum]|uniref:Uncharacterized protein n=1 Tax=Pelagibacterium luteolum TaxID=440168 RepID=A0A1G7Y595_9HYPH|nr:hypothetical protein [Pelagibacterium luteolum]SDG91584.1 hypothetical protein SAMN04487974_11260 [Pelagibacterium luteolum]